MAVSGTAIASSHPSWIPGCMRVCPQFCTSRGTLLSRCRFSCIDQRAFHGDTIGLGSSDPPRLYPTRLAQVATSRYGRSNAAKTMRATNARRVLVYAVAFSPSVFSCAHDLPRRRRKGRAGRLAACAPPSGSPATRVAATFSSSAADASASAAFSAGRAPPIGRSASRRPTLQIRHWLHSSIIAAGGVKLWIESRYSHQRKKFSRGNRYLSCRKASMSKVLERRNSFGGITPTSSASDSSKQEEKRVPHYLRASTGSCHDLCKHGYKNPLEEKLKLSGGRRKKLPAHLNNLTLHGSVILDKPKDVRNRNLSLAKSSISLGEADRTAEKVTTANLRGTVSSEHLVRRTASPADHKSVKSDGRKKHPMVAQGSPANPTYFNGIPKFDKKAILPVKRSKSEEKTLQEKPRTVEKATTVKQLSIKRPASLPTKLNSIKQVSVPSQASNHLASSKDRNTLKGKLTSPPATINGKRASNSSKAGKGPTRSSSANINRKEDLDISRTLFAIESEPTASVEIQEDDVQISCITGHNESTLAALSPDATEYADMFRQAPEETSRSVSEDGLDMSRTSFSTESELTASVEVQEDDGQCSCTTGLDVDSALEELSSGVIEYVKKSRPSPDETSRFISVADDGVESNENSEASSAEFPAKTITALELQQSFDDQEIKTVLSTSTLEHIQAEQNVIGSRASMDEEIQADDAALCQLSEQLTAVENADVYDSVLTESRSEVDADGVKVNTCVDSLITDSKEEVGAHEDLQASPELLALDEKDGEDPESCLDCASANLAENVKADEIVEVKNINSTSHCQSFSETSTDGELLEEPKSLLIEPIDSNVEIDELASVNNDGTFEQEELKSRIIVQQLPEELSDDEFYEEYDFELSESDESGAEDEGATINKNSDESSKAVVQRPRRISALHPDDASPTPYKLKFKRGKIVELTPDSSGPRRLKFRRKAANEVANGEGQSARRIYKRNSVNDGVTTNPDLESPGVKLRHQDAQEKKDAQGLFNNVIEETASKLAESRKSKVKALVGAFETVISLQDGNPTPCTPQAGSSPYPVHNDEEKEPEEAA